MLLTAIARVLSYRLRSHGFHMAELLPALVDAGGMVSKPSHRPNSIYLKLNSRLPISR